MPIQSPVLVTGATGYIAGHVIAELLNNGYQVRGTVRTASNTEKYAHLRALPGAERLEIVETDLLDDAGWDDAVTGCAGVLHVASPIVEGSSGDKSALTRAAVDGTVRVLEAAQRAGVSRVVYTSSIVAVTAGRMVGDDRRRTEADWGNLDRVEPYQRSKILAERAAWDFADQHPQMELVALNLGTVLGPLQRATVGASVSIVEGLLSGRTPAVPHIGNAVVDVRDVAVAHRLALEKPGAVGKRYLLAGDNTWMEDIAVILAKEFPPPAFRVPTKKMPGWVLKASGLFNPSAKLAAAFLNRPENVSSKAAQRDLGWTQRSLRNCIVDTANSLIEHGLVVPRVDKVPQ